MRLTIALCALLLSPDIAFAQNITGTARLTVNVRRDSASGVPVDGALVRGGTAVSRTNRSGVALLSLDAGQQQVVVTRLGYKPDTAVVAIVLNRDTSVTMVLAPLSIEINEVIVSSTRAERRVEDTPMRVEVIDDEEIAEKVSMSPGDIAMMLNETGGLRVQTTNPSLGGANVRIQGLRGRYTLLLADGLPLYGGQTGGLGLLQIPPVDLGRVEIIKGTASALYGSSALGGVIDLVSRRPGDEPERSLLLNRTSRGGTDGVFFGSAPIGERHGATLLAGAHAQTQNDIDSDGWTDMPGYTRYVVRPRIYIDNGGGRSAFLTGGFTSEDRDGGTMPGRVTPEGTPHVESLRSGRADVGALVRWATPDTGSLLGLRAFRSSVLTLRGSAVDQRHDHQFGSVNEKDTHNTWFGEASLAVPRGNNTFVGGIAYQEERYRAENVNGFDYSFSIPSVFAQFDSDVAAWMSLSLSARLDAHSQYGSFVSPRASLLFRSVSDGVFAGWTSRLSTGSGAFAPTPFVEEVEVTGLSVLEPLHDLDAERAASVSFDVGGPVTLSFADVEVNATLFASRVRDAVQVTESLIPGSARMSLVNAPEPVTNSGAELLLRFTREPGEPAGEEEGAVFRVTASYTFLNSRECVTLAAPLTGSASRGCVRGEVPLNPQHSAGVVATIEQEGVSRVGLELYYTGRQSLDFNPYRSESRPYLIVGLMGERAFETPSGTVRLFLNLENITNVRQTRFDPMLLPSKRPDGRWTTDAWTDLSGFTVNGGVKIGF